MVFLEHFFQIKKKIYDKKLDYHCNDWNISCLVVKYVLLIIIIIITFKTKQKLIFNLYKKQLESFLNYFSM